MQPGQNADRESSGTRSSATGQGGGEQQPNANQRMQSGQSGGSKKSTTVVALRPVSILEVRSRAYFQASQIRSAWGAPP